MRLWSKHWCGLSLQSVTEEREKKEQQSQNGRTEIR